MFVHSRYSNCSYDPFNTAGDSSKPVTSQQDTATESKFNKNPKRNNRKSKSKGQLDLNTDDAEANASRIYSEHYTEDIDTLLQFITSSAPPEPAANKNPKNKAVKQKPAAKQPTMLKQEASATTKASKNQSKPNTDKLVKPTSDLSKSTIQQPTDDKEKSEHSQLAKAKPAVAVTQLVAEDEELNEQVSLNNSGEFVTVKGRKLRKSTKKEVGPQTTQVKKENPTIVLAKNQVFTKPKPHTDSPNELSKKMPQTNAKQPVNPVKPKEEQIKFVL